MFRQKTFSVFLAALFFLAPLSRGYEAVDALGRKFEFSKPPVCATIVPAVTQNIFAIGADSFLVANSRFCVYPEGAKRKIKLGGYIDPDYEKIAELKPEIFILPSTADSRVERRLAKLGIKCFVLNAEGIENIAADIRLLGALFDKRSEAEKRAAEFERLISRSDEGRGRSALFMFGKMAAGKGSFVGGLLEACGLKNCAEKIGRPWAELPREFILSARPEILFVEYENEEVRAELEKYYKTDGVWRATPAVKNSMICFVPRNFVIIPSSRVGEALKLMRSFCASK